MRNRTLETQEEKERKKVIVRPIMCDCCGKEQLAEIKDGKLIIFTKRHGQRHFVTIDICAILSVIE